MVDPGDITGARGTELLLPLWVRLRGMFGTSFVNYRIVRGAGTG